MTHNKKSDVDFKVVPIELSYDKNIEYQSVLERYYTPRYSIDVGQNGEDFCVLFHSNRICVLTLAPSHPILNERKKITNIDYQVSANVDRLNNKVKGKGKHGAQVLTPTSALFFIECSDQSRYTIYSCVPGKLVEINEHLMENPNLIVERPSDKGYLAIILPPIHASDRYRKELLTHQQYQDEINKREQHVNTL